MKKVRFFQSIHFKFVLIYILLILIATQIIGAYFVQKQEENNITNFRNSINERVDVLAYSVEKEMAEKRSEGDPTLEEEIAKLLNDFKSEDISEISVVDKNHQVLAVSNYDAKSTVGKKSITDPVNKALSGGTYNNMMVNKKGERMRVVAVPVNSSEGTIGAIYLEASMESLYEQMKQVNAIFAKGTLLSLLLTAILGILLARTITRPMSDMRRQALEMAKGNFSRKVKVYGYDEIGQLAITFNNLTRKLQEAQATTEGERRKLASVLTNMTDGVIATDRKGRVILINEPAGQMLDVSRETVLSESILRLLNIEKEYTFDTLLEEQNSLILEFDKYDEPYILRATVSPIQKETGFINGIIVVLHDITEQEKIDRERREFVANVSHELRTPLTTMRSYLEALAEGAWQDKEIAPRFLDVTQTETERMIRLVNDLLQLSRMDSRDYHLTKSQVDFIDFYNHIIDRFDMSKSQNIEFVRKLPEGPISIQFDQDKITQVLDNIISNAIKYSPEGGKVTFSVQPQEFFILVSVKDEGMGIPREKVKKIFERFYRVDKARTRQLGGTGLGLAIAREMIEAHKGEIWAESKEGKGTTIHFTLPLQVEQDEDEWI
ncbi:cell wall metabolism sensor histidine kinase WalK [Priestia endophytica]|jgi:two-component system sensor histidine kinase VicK|uniref:histidine kinase n=1 Tax=Priestia endophytica DSM 13796 TaxID=1121089 RepID=A0A1I6BPT8_9BACI|nr:cell wall metabolism sensor histidine kinase WalK [Priestia endophytica]KAB2491492.1 cell wall metabolism sensor histidine kinase WalK [Priestia endophytica]KYG28670.1 PAS domain-containing sensor histidine kinase [Priestia endophytica]MBG9811974.1 histidine kinase [Priestia endophytica]RAS74940.1 cell wall metabolism sensor histidine kinase WalK [Priestia endophytica]RAS86660.1 cell wall metabolism sensor histidine kinase WalK [Priestia endophytica]